MSEKGLKKYMDLMYLTWAYNFLLFLGPSQTTNIYAVGMAEEQLNSSKLFGQVYMI